MLKLFNICRRFNICPFNTSQTGSASINFIDEPRPGQPSGWAIKAMG